MRRGECAVVVLVGALGCSTLQVHVVPELPEASLMDRGSTDPAIAIAVRACDDQRDPRACGQVAEWAANGAHGRAIDWRTSFRYATAGCTGGDGLACAVLGKHYENGLGVAWAPARAIEVYERSCTAGSGLGCDRLGDLYRGAAGVDEDRAKARAYHARAHELWMAGCLGAEPRWCTRAAWSPRDGEPTALALAQRACDHGFADGCIGVLREQLGSSPRSRDATMRELERWCERKESEACAELARAHEQRGGSRDHQRAAKLFSRACVLGDAAACITAGVMHQVEHGVPNDDATARRYFARACARGASHGCLYLAQELIAVGTPAGEIAVVAQRGCEMGSATACDLLAKVSVAVRDDGAVVRWSTEGCRMGLPASCRRLIERDLDLPKRVRSPLQTYRAACKANIASACLRIPPLVAAEADALRGVAAAIVSQDAGAFAKLVATELDVRGLGPDEPACGERFAGAVTLAAAEHPGLLQCLAKLGVRLAPPPDDLSPPSLADAAADGLAIVLRDGKIERIETAATAWAPWPPSGAAAHVTPRPVPPTALDAYRISGEKNIVPDVDTKRAISAAGKSRLVGSFKLCVTAHGTISGVAMLKSTGFVSYDRILERTIHAWRYRPFLIDGKPAPVCTAVTFIYAQGA